MADTGGVGSNQVPAQLGFVDLTADDSLQGIIDVAQRHDIEIVDWRKSDEPGAEGVCGRLEVRPEQASAVISELLLLPGWRCKLNVFPLGISQPTAIQIDVSTT